MTTATTESIDEIRDEIAKHSAEIVRIDSELKRLAEAKTKAQAKFNFACHRLGMLKQQEVTR